MLTSTLKITLDKYLGTGQWKDLEPETIISVLGLEYSALLHDKVSLMKAIEVLPHLFFEDTMFMLHATDVLNDEVADFDYVPHITSLELAFAIVEMALILGKDLNELPSFGPGATTVVRDVLIREGYSKVLHPFTVVGVGELHEGQTEEDTANKQKALEEYINAKRN